MGEAFQDEEDQIQEPDHQVVEVAYRDEGAAVVEHQACRVLVQVEVGLSSSEVEGPLASVQTEVGKVRAHQEHLA